MHSLSTWGWAHDLQSELEALSLFEHRPGRIIAVHRGRFDVRTAGDVVPAVLAGRLLNTTPRDRVTIGDWVLLEPEVDRIVHRFERRSLLARGAQNGRSGRSPATYQPIAANVDVVFVLTALNQDFNPRRLERYLSQVGSSGARSVVVLTKLDLCPNPGPFIVELSSRCANQPICLVSGLNGDGVESLLQHLEPRETAVLVGSSGVGKSTLLNRLMGMAVQKVEAAREDDDRGRHTTTHRELFALPGGGLLIDTPGVRSLGLAADDEAGVDTVFDDIAALQRACRFRDCSHQDEPGCAIAAAIASGTLTQERLDHQRKLRAELAWQERRGDRRASRQFGRQFAKMVRKTIAAKNHDIPWDDRQDP